MILHRLTGRLSNVVLVGGLFLSSQAGAQEAVGIWRETLGSSDGPKLGIIADEGDSHYGPIFLSCRPKATPSMHLDFGEATIKKAVAASTSIDVVVSAKHGRLDIVADSISFSDWVGQAWIIDMSLTRHLLLFLSKPGPMTISVKTGLVPDSAAEVLRLPERNRPAAVAAFAKACLGIKL